MNEPQTKNDRNSAPWFAVALLAGLAGGLLGAGSTWVALRSEPASTDRVARASDEALAGEVRTLAARIEELRQLLALQAAAAASDADTPAPRPLADDPALRASLDALTAALGPLTARAAADAPDARLILPAADPSLRASLEQQVAQSNPPLRSRHLFWTDQDLLNAYGAPDFITVQDGVEQWAYQLNAQQVAFALHLHRVIEVFSG